MERTGVNGNAELEINSLYLKRHKIFAGLRENELDAVGSFGKLHILRRGKRIGINGLQPDRLYFLLNGKLKTTEYTRGYMPAVREILYANEMFGNISLNGFEGEELAEALIPNTLVYCFNVNDFKRLLRQHHQLALNYAENLSYKLNTLKEKHAVWSNENARARLIFFFKKWASHEGEKNNGTIIIKNFLSLSDVAAILSVSRQFMYTLLNDLEKDSLLFYTRHQIIISEELFKEPVTD